MSDELRELDFQIAEQVMGWQRQLNYNYWMTFPAGETFQLHGHVATWRPSVDIKAAMEVVAYMRRSGYAITIEGGAGEGGWYVAFQPRTMPYAASGPDLPDCICRAALQAVKDQNVEHTTK